MELEKLILKFIWKNNMQEFSGGKKPSKNTKKKKKKKNGDCSYQALKHTIIKPL